MGSSPAIIWEPNNPEEHHRVLSYKQLHFKVNQFNVLHNNGVRKERGLYLYKMIPELAIAVLACARVRTVHSVILEDSVQIIADAAGYFSRSHYYL
jgi:acetyl-CoA synthetase